MDLKDFERRKRDMKKYKTTIIITTLITLLPIVIGLFLWNKLPDTLATHWGSDGTANGSVQQNIFCLRNAALILDCDPRFVPFCHFE